MMNFQTSIMLTLHWVLTVAVAFVGAFAAPGSERPTSESAAPQSPGSEGWFLYLPLVAQQPTPKPATDIWVSREALKQLPTTGPAWAQLKARADEAAGAPNLSDQDSDVGIRVLAKALVFARTGQEHYRTEVRAALEVITFGNTEDGGRTLALGRGLLAYVIAADLIDLHNYNPALDNEFRGKLRGLLTKPLEGWGSPRTLQETHELRPNNWGTNAGASRIAVALYLGDKVELARSARVFQGYLGDLAAYNQFEYADDLSWHPDPARPLGVNPPGASKDGHSIDGALPEEMRRGGPFQWPPLPTNYPWAALQGSVVQAALLQRAGYPAWEWQNKAMRRSVQFLYTIGWPAQGDDEWIMPLINCVYHTNFPVETAARPGKIMGWTDWTHQQCP